MGKFKRVIIGAVVWGLSSAVWAEGQAVVGVAKDWSVRFAMGSAPKLDEAEAEGDTDTMDGDAGGRFEILAAKRFWSENNPDIGGVFGAGLFLGGMRERLMAVLRLSFRRLVCWYRVVFLPS